MQHLASRINASPQGDLQLEIRYFCEGAPGCLQYHLGLEGGSSVVLVEVSATLDVVTGWVTVVALSVVRSISVVVAGAGAVAVVVVVAVAVAVAVAVVEAVDDVLGVVDETSADVDTFSDVEKIGFDVDPRVVLLEVIAAAQSPRETPLIGQRHSHTLLHPCSSDFKYLGKKLFFTQPASHCAALSSRGQINSAVVVVLVVDAVVVAVAIAAAQSSSGVFAIGHKHVQTLVHPVS